MPSEIFVRTTDGNICVEVGPDATGKDLYDKCPEGVLYFAGQPIYDNESLADLGVGPESFVDLNSNVCWIKVTNRETQQFMKKIPIHKNIQPIEFLRLVIIPLQKEYMIQMTLLIDDPTVCQMIKETDWYSVDLHIDDILVYRSYIGVWKWWGWGNWDLDRVRGAVWVWAGEV